MASDLYLLQVDDILDIAVNFIYLYTLYVRLSVNLERYILKIKQLWEICFTLTVRVTLKYILNRVCNIYFKPTLYYFIAYYYTNTLTEMS